MLCFINKKREIQNMNLCRHPNLLPVFGSFVNGSKLYIVTPYLSAGNNYLIFLLYI